MQTRSSPSCKHIWSLLLSYTLLGLLLTVSACVRIPATIPGDFPVSPAISSSIVRYDFARVVAVDQPEGYTDLDNASSIGIRVTRNGERFWILEPEFWNQKLWKPLTAYRFSLIENGVENAICTTGLKQFEADVKDVPCTGYTYHAFTQKFIVNDHLAKPLIGMLDYWVGGDETNPSGEEQSPTGVVASIFYLISDPIIRDHLKR